MHPHRNSRAARSPGPRWLVLRRVWSCSKKPPEARSANLAPGHQVLDPADTREIVIDDCHHEHHEDDETGEQHLLFDAGAEIAASGAFERHDENMAAVENGNRQE